MVRTDDDPLVGCVRRAGPCSSAASPFRCRVVRAVADGLEPEVPRVDVEHDRGDAAHAFALRNERAHDRARAAVARDELDTAAVEVGLLAQQAVLPGHAPVVVARHEDARRARRVDLLAQGSPRLPRPCPPRCRSDRRLSPRNSTLVLSGCTSPQTPSDASTGSLSSGTPASPTRMRRWIRPFCAGSPAGSAGCATPGAT